MNVGSGNHYSVNPLVELLGGDVVHIPKSSGEPDATFGDVSKIKRLLGWQATVSFEDGVERKLCIPRILLPAPRIFGNGLPHLGHSHVESPQYSVDSIGRDYRDSCTSVIASLLR